MGRVKKILFVLGRTFISLFFLVSFVEMVLYWHAAKDYCSQVVELWLNDFSEMGREMNGIVRLITLIQGYEYLIMAIAGVVELIGGILLFFGIRLKIGGLLLLLYLIPKTLICYPFWLKGDILLIEQLSNFMKNFAIVGSLFILLSIPSRGSIKRGRVDELSTLEEDEA